ncbi:unnamed protein product [Moneuplotes crassus]|uniref:Kelch motif family protein n=1 Tax=Euplotes crassus TaxID=5936 RepID=A0AAD2D639_EUPCR|nr:unnamed protein product [Moneuplotes crassus]
MFPKIERNQRTGMPFTAFDTTRGIPVCNSELFNQANTDGVVPLGAIARDLESGLQNNFVKFKNSSSKCRNLKSIQLREKCEKDINVFFDSLLEDINKTEETLLREAESSLNMAELKAVIENAPELQEECIKRIMDEKKRFDTKMDSKQFAYITRRKDYFDGFLNHMDQSREKLDDLYSNGSLKAKSIVNFNNDSKLYGTPLIEMASNCIMIDEQPSCKRNARNSPVKSRQMPQTQAPQNSINQAPQSLTSQMIQQMKPQVNQIQRPQVQQHNHPHVLQPSHPQVQQPSHSQVQQPSHSQVQQPSHSQVQQPSHSQVQQPSHSQIQQHNHPQVSQPQRSQNFPAARPQVIQSQKPQIAHPLKPQTSHAQQPQTPLAQRPQVAQAQRPQVTQTPQAQISQPVKPQVEEKQQVKFSEALSKPSHLLYPGMDSQKQKYQNTQTANTQGRTPQDQKMAQSHATAQGNPQVSHMKPQQNVTATNSQVQNLASQPQIQNRPANLLSNMRIGMPPKFSQAPAQQNTQGVSKETKTQTPVTHQNVQKPSFSSTPVAQKEPQKIENKNLSQTLGSAFSIQIPGQQNIGSAVMKKPQTQAPKISMPPLPGFGAPKAAKPAQTVNVKPSPVNVTRPVVSKPEPSKLTQNVNVAQTVSSGQPQRPKPTSVNTSDKEIKEEVEQRDVEMTDDTPSNVEMAIQKEAPPQDAILEQTDAHMSEETKTDSEVNKDSSISFTWPKILHSHFFKNRGHEVYRITRTGQIKRPQIFRAENLSFFKLLHNNKDQIYLLGGANNDEMGRVYSKTRRVDFTACRSEIIAKMNTARCNFGAIFSQDHKKIYVVGGDVSYEMTTDHTEVFDISKNEWTYLRPLNESKAKPGLAILGGYLYCFGGIEKQKQQDPLSKNIERLNLSDPQAQWELLDEKLPDGVCYQGIIPITSNECLLVGGTKGTTSSQTLIFKLPSSETGMKHSITVGNSLQTSDYFDMTDLFSQTGENEIAFPGHYSMHFMNTVSLTFKSTKYFS